MLTQSLEPYWHSGPIQPVSHTQRKAVLFNIYTHTLRQSHVPCFFTHSHPDIVYVTQEMFYSAESIPRRTFCCHLTHFPSGFICCKPVQSVFLRRCNSEVWRCLGVSMFFNLMTGCRTWEDMLPCLHVFFLAAWQTGAGRKPKTTRHISLYLYLERERKRDHASMPHSDSTGTNTHKSVTQNILYWRG